MVLTILDTIFTVGAISIAAITVFYFMFILIRVISYYLLLKREIQVHTNKAYRAIVGFLDDIDYEETRSLFLVSALLFVGILLVDGAAILITNFITSH